MLLTLEQVTELVPDVVDTGTGLVPDVVDTGTGDRVGT